MFQENCSAPFFCKNGRVKAVPALFLLAIAAAPLAQAQECAPASWQRLGSPRPTAVAPDALLDEMAKREVVLLGEQHDEADHHRWQLHTLAALRVMLRRSHPADHVAVVYDRDGKRHTSVVTLTERPAQS